MILHKPLYIKLIYHQGARSNGLVYNPEGSVNEQMIRSGWAVYYHSDKYDDNNLKLASDYARSRNLGVFGRCVQKVNTSHPTCIIKGNINGTTKIYHTTDCRSYKDTQVELYKGDQWFCTEKDARDAGFVKAQQCY